MLEMTLREKERDRLIWRDYGEMKDWPEMRTSSDRQHCSLGWLRKKIRSKFWVLLYLP